MTKKPNHSGISFEKPTKLNIGFPFVSFFFLLFGFWVGRKVNTPTPIFWTTIVDEGRGPSK